MSLKESKEMELKNIVKIITGHDYNLTNSQCEVLEKSFSILKKKDLSIEDCITADSLISKANINKVFLL
jgi:hypothetical protein